MIPSDWVEFPVVKKGVRLEQILRHYQIQGLRRSGRGRYRGRCPIHRGEGTEAFHVDLIKDVFHCFACGAGGTVLDLVAAMEGCRLREAALRLAAWFVVPSVPRASQERQLVTEKSKQPSPLPPLGFRLAPVVMAHSYLRRRGIEEWTAAEFGVGFYAGPGLLSGRVVIPIHDPRGQLVAYCGRSLDGSVPRYKFPAGFPKSQVLFNLHRAAASGEAGVVVEGFFDCLKVHQAGFRSVVALMGSALSDHQFGLLTSGFRQVLLMLDGDQAGRRAAGTIAARLAPRCALRVIELGPGIQPDQLPADAIRELLGVK